MKKVSIAILLLLLVTSCARRSGSTNYDRNRDRGSSRSISIQTPPQTSPTHKVEIIHEATSKMDGPEIFRKFDTAVFMVFTSDGQQGYQGSGFFINGHGLAVSNYHVFKGTYRGKEKIKLVGSDQAYRVIKVIAKSEEQDYIVFEVNITENNYIPIATDRPKIGERVFAIGSPRGLENTFSSGDVSQWRLKDVMQTNVQIDHGSSGGPLINECGQVVGITSGTFAEDSQASLNYAWSIDVIKSVLR